ncbi:MAG: 3-deoxy-D-manno-octulosonic acid transferase, partial [Flavobacteriaceae bacterium]|nr:3-deoxy-D-manno-octulosonic acid transferase [Flavobacteriaceae bacterium]
QAFKKIESAISSGDRSLWFHCASLGEYEQGLPVFEEIKKDHPDHKIVLSFFSPSGYEIKKDSSIADVVLYLPLDTPANANKLVNMIQPSLTVFVKNEIWPNYLKALKNKGIKTLLISANFRKDEIHFKWYGGLMRKSLRAFSHIFVQDEDSKTNLKSVGLNDVTISGDTRFDRVNDQLKIDNHVPRIDEFKGDKLCLVAGSTWPEGEALITKYINSTSIDIKFIIAPHNINNKQINQLSNNIKVKSILYSGIDGKDLSDFNVLIIDCIGLLSKLYSFADIAYVGGALGKTGLHNTLEPAIFKVPIVVGTNHEKFPEARNMIAKGGMFEISNPGSLENIFNELAENESFRKKAGEKNLEYIKENQGAVVRIMDYIRK